MNVEQAGHNAPLEGEPAEHDLPPVRCDGVMVAVRALVRRADDGTWRGRLVFGDEECDAAPATAEILFGPNEAEFWQAVRDLGEYHIRDLYRAVSE